MKSRLFNVAKLSVVAATSSFFTAKYYQKKHYEMGEQKEGYELKLKSRQPTLAQQVGTVTSSGPCCGCTEQVWVKGNEEKSYDYNYGRK